MRAARGYIGSLLIPFERRSVQLMSLLALGLAVALVAVPPFGRPPRTQAEPEPQRPAPPKVAVTTPLELPRPAAGDDDARAVVALARRGVGIRSGGGTRRWVALTFDDGPGPYTERLLVELERLKVPATFFQVGRMLQEFPAAARRASETADVTIGDHTYSHSVMPQLGRAGQQREILQAAALMQASGEAPPRLFRPPYGAWDTQTQALTRQRGMAIVLWNVDSQDYKNPGVRKIVRNVVSAVRPGSIVLMHDAGGRREQTIAAVRRIVKRLRARGYRFVTVDRMLADDPPRRRDDFGAPRIRPGVAG